jgi:hypothetical protein
MYDSRKEFSDDASAHHKVCLQNCTNKCDVVRSVRDNDTVMGRRTSSTVWIKTICNISNAGSPVVRDKVRAGDDEPG